MPLTLKMSIPVLLLLCSFTTVAQPLVVTLPPKQASADSRSADVVEILKMALEKTTESDGEYILKESEHISMNPWRYKYQLVRGDDDAPNVIWLPASRELDEELLSVPIPILKGLLGIRVLLINREDQALFSAINDFEELKELVAGQGATWVDVEVLRANGIFVVTGFDYQGLFDMLKHRRFDYFPRGVNEVFRELEEQSSKYPDMVIEETILLQYPFPVYFYVNKKNTKLAERLEKGMNIMIRDGSLDEILQGFDLDAIEGLNIPSRKIFILINPLLTEEQEATYNEFLLNHH